MAPLHLQRIRVAATYDAPASRVFDAWLNPRLAARWLFATALEPAAPVAMEPRVAGRFCFLDGRGRARTAWRGEYVEIVPPRRLAFTLELDDGGGPTRVTVTLAGRGAGCRLRLVHEGVPRQRAAALADRWTGLLYGLGTLLGAAPEPHVLTEHAP